MDHQRDTVLIIFNCLRSLSVVAERHAIPYMHELFGGIWSKLQGKFSGINNNSIYVLGLQLVLNLQADTSRALYNYPSNCSRWGFVCTLLHLRSLNLFLRICEEWSFALIPNLGCECGWSGSGSKNNEKSTTLFRNLNKPVVHYLEITVD